MVCPCVKWEKAMIKTCPFPFFGKNGMAIATLG